jgi:hypothetical protein
VKQLLAAILLPVFLSSSILAQTPPRSGGARGTSGQVEPAKPSPAADKLVPPVPPPVAVPTELPMPATPVLRTPVYSSVDGGIGVGQGTGPGFVIGPLRKPPKDGEAQAVIFDANNRPALKFTNKQVKKQSCGLFVSYWVMGQEEVFALRVTHLHFRYIGGVSLTEKGWLYITPSRIIFRVVTGDESHAFDIPRTDLKDKPATIVDRRDVLALQLNLRERLPASESREQKFALPIFGDKRCYVYESEPYAKFLKRAVNDFNGAMAEFKQIVAALKESGKIEQVPTGALTLFFPGERGGMSVPSDPTIGPSSTPAPTPSLGIGPARPDDGGVNITSDPVGAEIYANGTFIGVTPMRTPFGVGEYTIRVTKPGYKDWEQKIIVERRSFKDYNIVLEKQ